MSNDLTMFDPKAGMPAHVAGFFSSEDGSNIDDRLKVNSLSPQGKQWTISLDGNKTTLMRMVDGEQVPVNVMKVVVLDYAKRRGRAYYEGAYDPATEAAPVCWSEDGIAPPMTVEKRQSDKCETCPMAAKGSKVTDQGKATAACSQHRMLAIVPANKLDFPPLRLKIAITSDFDKQSPDAEAQGWYGFSNFTDFLKSRGVQHTAAVVTKMKFDTNAAYPKIFFAADRWLEPEELAVVAPLTKSDVVQQLLGGTWTPAGPDGVKQDTLEKPSPEKDPEPAAATKPEPEPEPEAPAETPAQKALREAQELVAAEEAAKVTETPTQKALREAMAAVAAEAKTGKPAAGAAGPTEADLKLAGDDGDDGAIIGLDAPPAKAGNGAAQADKPVAQETGAAKTVDPALASLLAEWSE